MPDLVVELYGQRIGLIFEHAAISRDDLTNEVGAWGSRWSRAWIDSVLESIRDVARAEDPHPAAEPTMKDEILRFTQNLLDGRAAGARAR